MAACSGKAAIAIGKGQHFRVAVRCAPGRNESLHGWMVRLAAANGYSSSRQILGLIRCAPGSNVIGNLIQLVDGSTADFERFVIDGNMMFHGGELRLHHRRFSLRPKVCPRCLAEKGQLQSVWNLRLWQYCPEHCCALISVCPFCGNPLTKSERYVGHCGNARCHGNLSKARARRMPPSVRSIVGLLGDLAAERRGIYFPDLGQRFDDLCLADILAMISMLSRPFVKPSGRFFNEIEVRRSLLVAQAALTDWPAGFHGYLHRVRSSGVGTPSVTISNWTYLQREFPFLMANLKSPHSGISARPLEAMREEMASYIEEHLPYAINARLTLTGKPSTWVSFWGAVHCLQLSVHKAREVLKGGTLDIRTVSDGGNLKYLVRRADLNHLKARVQSIKTKAEFRREHDLILPHQASKLLGVRAWTVRNLVEANLVKAVQLQHAICCSARSIDKLMNQLTKVSTSIERRGNTLIELTSCSNVSAAKPSDVIGNVLDGKLKLFSWRKRSGMRGFLIEKQALVKRFPIIPRGYFTLAEATKDSCFSRGYIAGSIRLGLLACIPHPRGKGMLICRDGLAKLQRRYVSCKELATIYGLAYVTISEELKRAPKPVAVGSGVWLRKAALARLDATFLRI